MVMLSSIVRSSESLVYFFVLFVDLNIAYLLHYKL